MPFITQLIGASPLGGMGAHPNMMGDPSVFENIDPATMQNMMNEVRSMNPAALQNMMGMMGIEPGMMQSMIESMNSGMMGMPMGMGEMPMGMGGMPMGNPYEANHENHAIHPTLIQQINNFSNEPEALQHRLNMLHH